MLPSHLSLDPLKGLVVASFLRSGAAQESNLPTDGLRRLTGFEDRLGHQPRAAPPLTLDAKARARNSQAASDRFPACSRSWTSPTLVTGASPPKPPRPA